MRESSNEWYTPPRYLVAARAVMGHIDLDPASCELANETVQANQIYTKHQNGLQQRWFGNVWLNPPFGRCQTPGQKTNQGLWIKKLVHEYQSGHIQQAILLTTCRPDTSWFDALWDYAICFADHKVGFYIPSEGRILQEYSHAHGTLFVYLGPDNSHFIETFKHFGPVVTPTGVYRKMSNPTPQSLWDHIESEVSA